ncbi:pickpocket protein 11-like [Drosophila busckii]|uniref:pickpocket protein 11-like n=1 Tax=Drosophila busckii TaxID=30019 RepID=UPI00083EE5F9|nr:pickpocket protein 11-like [Drosophila busckii]
MATQQKIHLINFEQYLRPKQPHKITPLQCFDRPETKLNKCCRQLKRLKLLRWHRQLSGQVAQALQQLPLPRFLHFLRARQDDGLCKPKTGFEIYCEMSSIHGFHIFVGACTWQRVLWWLLICTAVLLSLLVLFMSHLMSKSMPTISYIDAITRPMSAAPMPFPALTICSLNRVSSWQLQQQAKQMQLP